MNKRILAGLVGAASLAVLVAGVAPEALARGRNHRGNDDGVRTHRVFKDHVRHTGLDDHRREDRRFDRREDRRKDRREDRRLDRRVDSGRHGLHHGLNHR